MKTCPYCKEKHSNQEFSPYCDIDCVIDHRRDYDKACDLMDEEWREKYYDKLKNIICPNIGSVSTNNKIKIKKQP